MQESKKGKLFALLGGIGFIAYAAYYMVYNLYYISTSEYYSLSWNLAVWWITYIFFAVLLFVKKKNPLFLIPAALEIILELYTIILYFRYGLFENYPLERILLIIAYIMLFVLLLVNVIPSMKSLAGATKVLCFIPAGLIYAEIMYVYIKYEYSKLLDGIWLYVYILSEIMHLAGYLFLGLWLRLTMSAVKTAVRQYSYTTPVVPQTSEAPVPKAVGDADELKKYKELLDSGVITQEEFEMKKRQILGLNN